MNFSHHRAILLIPLTAGFIAFSSVVLGQAPQNPPTAEPASEPQAREVKETSQPVASQPAGASQSVAPAPAATQPGATPASQPGAPTAEEVAPELTSDANTLPATEEVQTADETISEDAPEEKKPSWTDHISLKGDLRYRFELIKKGDGDLRYRHRVRARGALKAKVFSDLNATVGIGTGGPDGSHGDGDPKSNNQTLTNGFSSKFIWLDLAFFDYHPAWFDGLSLKGGKMKNPLYRVGKSELLWDPDLNPEGMSLSYQRQFGEIEPFVHGVGYFVEERKADDDTWLLGAQAGLKVHFLDGDLYALAGGRYMDYSHLPGRPLIWDVEDAFGNGTAQVDEDGDGAPDLLVYSYDYNIIGGFAEIGGKLGPMPWAVFGDVAVNAAVDDNNVGWLAGALLGSAKKPWQSHIRYIYRQVASDAVFGLFTDSDFMGGNTDGKGHEINYSLALHERVQFATTYFFNQTPIDATAENPEVDYHRLQVDLKMKF
ncbi:MAG: putative porin [Myxococcota bacterium]|nr:putative porin [Myxococcota bacterium]